MRVPELRILAISALRTAGVNMSVIGRASRDRAYCHPLRPARAAKCPL